MAEKELSPIDIKLEGIGHILRDRRLTVPAYQRRYSWEEEEVGDFWWDLKAAFGSSSPQYFLGTIVLARESGAASSTIIDGQQRLTTTSLLFLALRNEFLRRGDVDRAQVIEHDYGNAFDLRLGRDVTRLRLNAEDQPLYELAMRRPTNDPNDRIGSENESRLERALVFFEKQIQDEAKDAGHHWAENLFRWVEFLEHRARVINVAVANEADAFLIFETLNARGRALTVADLLKNYLFGLAGDELDALQKNWISALRALETSADEEVFTTYVRHLWSSSRGATRERELYARLKAAITAKPVALAFGRELEAAAPLYAALLSADQPFWATRTALRPRAETLLRLGLQQNRPLLLSAMRHFGDDELNLLLKFLISWSMRGLIVGGLGGGSIERAYVEAAVAVSEGRAATTAAIFEEMASVIPTDEIFRQAFTTRRINRTTIAKYVLVSLAQAEEQIQNAFEVPDAVEASYQLFSILPRNAAPEEWPSFEPDEISQWAFRLGNLYVINETEAKKKPAGQLINALHWTPSQLASRQETLADAAVALWPRRP